MAGIAMVAYTLHQPIFCASSCEWGPCTLYKIVLSNTEMPVIKFQTKQYNVVQYSIVQYNTIQYNNALMHLPSQLVALLKVCPGFFQLFWVIALLGSVLVFFHFCWYKSLKFTKKSRFLSVDLSEGVLYSTFAQQKLFIPILN